MKEKEMLSCYGEENEEEKQKEWKKFKEELCALQEELMEILKEKKGSEAKTIFFGLIWKFGEEIEKKYGNCRDYLAFHILARSDPNFNHSQKLDFAEPFSVKSFLLKEIRKFKSGETEEGETEEEEKQREKEEEEKLEEWEKLKGEIYILRKRLMEILKEKKGSEAKTIFFKLMGDFAERIREKYKDCEKYLAYHIIISSGTEFYYSPKLDFPEPSSVKSFLEGKIKEYEENKTD